MTAFSVPGRLLVAVLAIAAFVVAGCGSSASISATHAASATSPTGGSSSSSSGSASSAAYDGPEAKLPVAYGPRVRKPGTKCVVGYDDAIAAESTLLLQQTSATAELKQLGCKVIPTDANGDVNTQVSNINNLTAQGINGLISYPLDPNALVPSYKRLTERKVPVVNISTPGYAGGALLPGVSTEILEDVDRCAYDTMQHLAQVDSHGTFTVIGYAAPVPALQHMIASDIKYGEQFGLKFLGQVNEDASATPQAETAAATTLLSKYPTVSALVAFDDDTALVASALARQTGKNILVTGRGGQNDAIDAVKQGRLESTFYAPLQEEGKQAGIAIYDEITDQHLPLPKEIAPLGTFITKANASHVHGV